MPNGNDDRYNPRWCKERHEKIEQEFRDVWGEHGFIAVWNKVNNLDRKFTLILLGIFANMGGIIAVLFKMAFG